jgi:GNAT superfamily N-acetyltransferase
MFTPTNYFNKFKYKPENKFTQALIESILMNMAVPIAENFHRFREYFGQIAGARISREPGVTMIDTGIPYPNWNAIISSRPEFLPTQEEMAEYISFYQLPCSWWIGPEMQWRDLGEIIQDYGFVFGGGSAAMSLELKNFHLESSTGPDINIFLVSNPTELEQYLEVLQRSFHMPLYTIESLYSLYSHKSTDDDVTKYHYLGIDHGKAVACASLFLAGGSAGIYHVGVLPGLWGKGIGKKMTSHCLQMACELGCRISVLRASKQGEGMYAKLGFKEYGQFHLYYLNHHRLKNFLWKLNYYSRYVKDKFTGDAIWFS